MNEILDHNRVGKTQGSKLPPKLLWKDAPITTPSKTENILKIIPGILIEWSTYMCGFIENKDESFMKIPFLLDEEILNQIKEDRMYKLLQNDVREYEQKLQTNDDEFYEVGLEISNMIFEYLVDDVISFQSQVN